MDIQIYDASCTLANEHSKYEMWCSNTIQRDHEDVTCSLESKDRKSISLPIHKYLD